MPTDLKKQPYRLVGRVQPGQGRGEETGAKTANLAVSLAVEAGIAPGLYRCEAKVLGQQCEGLLYYGINSLTNEDCLEVHLLHFSGELRGETIDVLVGDFLRPPIQFNSVEALKEQIKKDLTI